MLSNTQKVRYLEIYIKIRKNKMIKIAHPQNMSQQVKMNQMYNTAKAYMKSIGKQINV